MTVPFTDVLPCRRFVRVVVWALAGCVLLVLVLVVGAVLWAAGNLTIGGDVPMEVKSAGVQGVSAALQGVSAAFTMFAMFALVWMTWRQAHRLDKENADLRRRVEALEAGEG